VNKFDDELIKFEAEGAAPLPDTEMQGYVKKKVLESGMLPMALAFP